MRKLFTTILCSIALTIAYSQVGTTVVISQVYGGGGNSGATYQNDYVELFNPTQSAVSLNNWSVQYASAGGSSWAVAKLTNFSLQPGQYYLVKLASGGAVGAALPTEDATGPMNLSATNGKVVLSNDTLSISSCLPNAAIVDMVGFGTANCFEGAAAAPSGSNTNGIFRANNGCQDGNNNGNDFAAATPSPRNSSSPINSCGAATAVLFSQPAVLSLTAAAGVASETGTYNVSGSTLSPAAGNITITPGTNVEISLSSTGPFVAAPATLSIPYTGGTLAATPVYARVSAAAPQGAFSSIVTNSGGGAPDAITTINAAIYQIYYNTKANLGLNNTDTWSNTEDGLGSSPTSFNDPFQVFVIASQLNANYTGVWDVSSPGNTSRVVVGNSILPITFTVLPGADSVTQATRIDVLNNATLVLQNNRRPFISLIDVGSTIDFAQTGTTTDDTIRIPALSYYNLKLTDGLKYLSTGTTTVRGDFTMDGLMGFNGSGTGVSKLNVFGNISSINQSAFDASDIGRITIGMNGVGAQSITGNGTEFRLFRLQRDTTTSPMVITLGAGTPLFLGTSTGGGLQLTQGGGNTTTLNITNNTINLNAAGFITPAATGVINSNGGTININKNAGGGDAGNLRFVNGALLNTLNLNFDPAFARDSINLYDTVVVQNLVLNKGKLVVNTNAAGLVDIPLGGGVTGGSPTAYVDGKIRRTGNGSMVYPTGSNSKYAPVTVAVTAGGTNSYTARYFFQPYGTYTVDPTTLANFPTYNVSKFEYWTVDQAVSPGTADLTFSWLDAGSNVNDVAPLRVAHFDGTDWNDIGGTVTMGSTTTNGSITAVGVTTFSPFTLAATQFNVLPVKLEYIRGQRSGSSNMLNWKVTCTSASINMEIERAADTRNFSSIGNISATQARCNQPFDFRDASPLAGYNYYRLKMIDIDGHVSYSPVVLINSQQKGFTVVGIYPSVVNSQASLSLSSSSNTQAEIRITDMSGRILQRTRNTIPAGSSLLNIDCSTLAAGYYNVTVTNAEGISNTLRFIKQ